MTICFILIQTMENQIQSSLDSSQLNQRQQELLQSIINSKSSNSLHRSQVGTRSSQKSTSFNRFYEEAFHKQSRHQEKVQQANLEQQRKSNDKKISKNSTNILMQKLERTLNEVFLYHYIHKSLNEVDPEGMRMINFQQLGRLFTILEIFKEVQYTPEFELEDSDKDWHPQRAAEMRLHDLAWTIMTNQQDVEQIDVRKVFCFMRILLDPENLPKERQTTIIKEYLDKIEQCSENLGELILQFCGDFKEIQKSRLASVKIGYLKPTFAKNLIEDYQRNLTFKPVLNDVSEALQNVEQQSLLKPSQRQLLDSYSKSQSVSQVLSDSNRIEQLLLKEERRQIKIQMKQQEKEEKVMEECSFQPQINPNSAQLSMSKSAIDRLYQFKSRLQLDEIERQAKEQRMIQELDECTFQPQLQQPLAVEYPTDVRNFNETVQRMRKAIDLNNLQKQQSTTFKDQTLINTQRRKLRKSKSSPLGSSIDALQTKEIKRVASPVNKSEYGRWQVIHSQYQRVGSLSLKIGDNPEVAVRNFVKVWGIGREETQDLMGRVYEEMEKLQAEQGFEGSEL